MAEVKDFKDVLTLVGDVKAMMDTYAGKGSLIEYSQPARVEPIAMVDTRFVHLPYATDVMNTLVNIFSGYYLQAISLSTMKVGNVNVLHALQKFNPNAPLVISKESLNDMFAGPDQYEVALPSKTAVSLEDAFGVVSTEAKDGGGNSSTIRMSDLTKEANALSVGKMLEVTIQSGNNRAAINVAVRVLANAVSPTTLTHNLSENRKNSTAKERYYGMRAGSLKFLKDIIFTQDLIEAHKKSRVRDADNVFDDIRARRNKNTLAAIFRSGVSFGTASNIVVMTDQTRKEIEAESGLNLSYFKDRERIFADTYTMLMAVVDTEWEQVIIYHRSLDRPSELSLKDIKSSERRGGPDVGEILKAYQLGNSPNL